MLSPVLVGCPVSGQGNIYALGVLSCSSSDETAYLIGDWIKDTDE